MKPTSIPPHPQLEEKLYGVFSRAGMGGFSYFGFHSFKMPYWQHCPEPQSLVEGRDWPVSGWPKRVPESPSYFPLPNSEGSVLLLLRTCQSSTSSLLFSHSSLPLQTLGKKSRKAHQPRSLFTSLCFPARPEQTSINSARSHPPSSLLSCPLCVVFFSLRLCLQA